MAVIEAPRASASTPAPPPSSRARRAGSSTKLLLAAGTLCMLLAMTALWTWRTFASSQGFADVATDMLRDPEIRSIVSDQIVDTLEQQRATAQATTSVRPILEQVVATVVATDEFQGVFHANVRELHAGIVNGRRSRLMVDVDEARELVREGLRSLNPAVASSIPDGVLALSVGLSQSTVVDTVIRVAEVAGWLALPLLLLAIGCFAVAVVRSRHRRRTVERVGWCLLGLGVGMFVVLHLAGGIASRMGATELEGHAFRGMFWSVTNLLSIQSSILVTAGAVLVLAGAYAGTGQLRVRASAAWQALWNRLEQPGWKAAASLLLIGLAVAAMVWPAAVAAVVVRAGAFVGFVAGAVGLLDLVGSHHWSFVSEPAAQRRVRRIATGSVAVVGAVSALTFFGGLSFIQAVRAPSPKSRDIAETGCNGAPELCDRHLDEVVLAGSHNAMATTDDDFVFPNQRIGIVGQLAMGIRAMLLDLWPGARTDAGYVRTDFVHVADYELTRKDMTEQQRKVTEGLMEMAGASFPDDRREVFLCHLACERGAAKAVDAFRAIESWLRENPNNVIVLVLEDHVDGAAAIKVLQQSGLAKRAFAWDGRSRLPTLRQMIQAKQNVLVMAEKNGGGAPWYHKAWEGLLQDTNYKVGSVDEFDCKWFRGQRTSPLLLANNWLNVSGTLDAADQANTRDVLKARYAGCKTQRQDVNIIAADFVDHGEFIKTVRELNGVAAPEPALAAPTSVK